MEALNAPPADGDDRLENPVIPSTDYNYRCTDCNGELKSGGPYATRGDAERACKKDCACPGGGVTCEIFRVA